MEKNYDCDETGAPKIVRSLDEVPALFFFNGNFDNKDDWEKTLHNAQGYVDYLGDILRNKLSEYNVLTLA